MLHKAEFSVSIDHHLKIIRHKHTGLIQKENLIEFWQELSSLKEFTNPEYNLLSDFRSAKIDVSISSISEILEKIEEMKPVFERKRHSLIIEDPHSVALAMLFMDVAVKKIGIKLEIFSTESAAIAWLQK